MYTIYSQIIKNEVGHVCSLVSDKFHMEFKTIGGFSITSYIPHSDIANFIMKLSSDIRDVFDNSSASKTEVFYITVSRKRSRVFTVVDSEPRNSRPYIDIAEIVLILPILEWETLFNVQEEIKDFFQENLC